jgi:hypothetical protein
MTQIRKSSRAAALFIAALIIPFNIPNRSDVLAQDLEPQSAPGDLDTSFGNGAESLLRLQVYRRSARRSRFSKTASW